MRIFAAVACAVAVVAAGLNAQQPPPAAQGSMHQRYAPIDLTGTWVSIVTEDWAARMVTPPRGNFESLPLTRAAQEAANRVDIGQVEAAGRACEAYGAPVIMREPGRVRIAWQDGSTLRIETDAGQQTRLLRFDPGAQERGAPALQGLSVAEWQYAGGFDPVRAEAARVAAARAGGDGAARAGGAARGGGRGAATATAPAGGRLKVVTTNLRPGFLRKNGVPYSAATTVTEYYNLLTEQSGTTWFVVTTIVNDPENLAVDFITSSNFRREPNDAGWRPRPCTLR